MDTRFWISGAVISLLWFALSFVVHGLLLGADYTPLAGTLFRTPEDAHAYMPFMIVAHLLMGFALTWIYRQGKSAGPSALTQGLRFGIAIAALMIVPMYLIYYTVQPMPPMLVVKQIIFDSLAVLMVGVAVAYLNRAPGEA